jgi:hypothetical protein
MVDRLARVRSIVEDKPIPALRQTSLLRNLIGNFEHVSNEIVVFRLDAGDIGDMFLWYNENVYGRGGVDVIECNTTIVGKPNLCLQLSSGDFAEDVIGGRSSRGLWRVSVSGTS